MVSLLVGLVVGQATGGYALRLAPGDTWTVEEHWRFLDFSDNSELDHSVRKVVFRVKKADAAGYDVEISNGLVGTIIGTESVPPPKGSQPLVTQEHWKRDGTVDTAPFEFDQAQQARLWRLTRLPMPSMRGFEGSWSGETPALEALRTPAATWSIGALLNAGSKPQTARWEMGFREDSTRRVLTGTGKATVDVQTGLAVEMSWKVLNAPLPGNDAPATLVLTSKRVPR